MPPISPKLRDNIPGRDAPLRPPEPGSVPLFIFLRLVSFVIQFHLLVWNGSYLSNALTPIFGTLQPINSDRLNLHISFVLVAVLRQILLFLGYLNTNWTISASIGVCGFNFVVELINAILLTLCGSSTLFSSPFDVLAVILFGLGMLFDVVSEWQRQGFKNDTKNKGVMFTGGLFSLTMHPNYFGYTLWRGGVALLSGSAVWGLVTLAFFTNDFLTRGIPVLQKHMKEKYPDQFTKYSKETAKFFPFLY